MEKMGKYFCTNNVLENSHNFFCTIQRTNVSVLGPSSPGSILSSGCGKCGCGPLRDVIKGTFSIASNAESSILLAIWAYQAHFRHQRVKIQR